MVPECFGNKNLGVITVSSRLDHPSVVLSGLEAAQDWRRFSAVEGYCTKIQIQKKEKKGKIPLNK